MELPVRPRASWQRREADARSGRALPGRSRCLAAIAPHARWSGLGRTLCLPGRDQPCGPRRTGRDRAVRLDPQPNRQGRGEIPGKRQGPAVAVGAERNGRLGRSDARRKSLVRSARGRGGKANLAGKIEHVLDFGKEIEGGTRSYCRRRRRVEGGRNEPFPRQNRPRDSFPANVRIHGRHAFA